MSNSFIGSKIAIITKSQCRYTGTIIGIDSPTSSIVLGNVKCFGTENRAGNFASNPMVGTIVPIMQFANSDIEDLKIVEEEPIIEKPAPKQPSYPMSVLSSPPAPPLQKQSSIHDDPAIVSAVISTANKDLSMSNRLVHDLQRLNLSDQQPKKLPNTEESRIRPDSGELGASWSVFTSSPHQPNPPSGNKSKFFDGFSLNNPDPTPSNRSQQPWPSNTHSTQTSRPQERYSHKQDDDNGLPIRQPFFSNDRPYPSQQNRSQNGYIPNQQRYFYNNRRPPMNNQQRRFGHNPGGNRETFYDNRNNYDDEFDFETSNQKFNKITSEEEFKQQSESPNQFFYSKTPSDLTTDYEPIYDKKKSFFDNTPLEETSDVQGPMYNRSRNQDTFGNDRNQYQGNRRGGGYRRSNNNYRQQQQGNDNSYYRQNNNGYQYRY